MSPSILVSRIALVAAFAVLAFVAVRYRARTTEVLRRFFLAEGHALNLAVFRIVLFAVLFVRADLDSIGWYAALSAELRFPPPGWEGLLAVLPVTPEAALAAAWVVKAACVFGMVGLWSRASAATVFVVGLYALGVLQFYGKVSHFHHLMWFAALLALSPAGHALSVDAWLRARRGARAGALPPPERHRAYALPLRFVWLLMGLVYFFPGFWKAWRAGARWALSDNLRLTMYQKWTEFGDWAPAFRIDHYPVLYQAAGAATILFELSFLLLILFPLGRAVALVGGLAFHQMTNAFMRISFWHLQPMYVSFVDWAGLGRWLGRRVHAEPLVVRYDPTDARDLRLAWGVRGFDVLQRVELVAGEPGAGIVAEQGGDRLEGAAARAAVARRVPPVRLLLGRGAARPRTVRRAPALGLRAIALVGAMLFGANLIAGVLDIHSWPISGYPTFAYFSGDTYSVLRMEVETASGRTEALPVDALLGEQAARTPARIRSLMGKVVSERNPRREAQLRALFAYWLSRRDGAEPVRAVRFYRTTYTTWAQGRPGVQLRDTLVYTFEPETEAPRVEDSERENQRGQSTVTSTKNT